MISIVIPLYNKEKQIENTLTSVFKQTFQDFEIIIVNDGSTDRSAEIVRQIKDCRIRLIEQENQGVSVARNTGIGEAKFEHIAFLDADDEWKPTYLESQTKLIAAYPQCDVFGCAYEFCSRQGTSSVILNKMKFSYNDGVLSNYFEVAAYSHPPLWTSAVIVTKKSILAVGGFPKGIASGEDLLVWAKLAFNYQIAYNKTPLAIFIHPGDFDDRSLRVEMNTDSVYSELLLLLNNSKGELRSHIKKYIGRWNEMRVTVFLKAKNKKKSILPLWRVICFKGISVKVFFYIFVILSPASFQKRLIKFVNNIRKK